VEDVIIKIKFVISSNNHFDLDTQMACEEVFGNIGEECGTQTCQDRKDSGNIP
jgi:hypothetical protein